MHVNKLMVVHSVDDGSWRIRYAAIRGLLAVCHLCRSQVVKDGFSDTAWERVIQVHSREKDRKVFEAFKMPPVSCCLFIGFSHVCVVCVHTYVHTYVCMYIHTVHMHVRIIVIIIATTYFTPDPT